MFVGLSVTMIVVRSRDLGVYVSTLKSATDWVRIVWQSPRPSQIEHFYWLMPDNCAQTMCFLLMRTTSLVEDVGTGRQEKL